MKKYRDEIAKICHEIVADGHRLGIINDAEMKEFETDCFAQKPKSVHEVEKFLKTERLTQASV